MQTLLEYNQHASVALTVAHIVTFLTQLILTLKYPSIYRTVDVLPGYYRPMKFEYPLLVG